MPGNTNPIKYSDLISPDNAIAELIKQLEQLSQTYSELSCKIKAEAQQAAQSLKTVTGATEEGRITIRQTAETVDALTKQRQKLAEAENENAVELARLKKATQEANRIAKLTAQLNAAEEGSYNKLSAQYSLNKIRLNALSEEYRKNNEEGKRLEKETLEIYEKMKALQEATGKYTLNVGNYKSAFDGLGVSFQQIARELPSLAVSANTFFLAISNNLPMFFDEINKIRTANAIAAKEGGQQVSVWKSLGSAIFSWNTAITLAITALTLFGGKLIEWVKTLFQSKEEIDLNAKAMEQFNEALLTGSKNAQKELAQIKVLLNIARDNTREQNERAKAIKALSEQYPEYLKNLNEENIKTDDLSVKIKQLTDAILENARARAAMDKIQENMSNQIDLEFQLTEATEKQAEAQRQYNDAVANLQTQRNVIASQAQLFAEQNNLRMLKNTLDSANAEIERINNEIAATEEANKRLEKIVNVSAIVTTKKPDGKTDKEDADKTAKQTLELQRKAQDAQLKLIVNYWDRRRTEIRYQYTRQIEDLRLQLDNEKDITKEGRKAINDTIEALEQQRTSALLELEKERQIKELQLQKETIDLRLQAVRQGTEQEIRLKLEQIEVEKKLALLQKTNQSENDIVASFESQRKGVYSKYIQSQMQIYDAEQEFAESEIDLMKGSEDRKTRLRLHAEKDRLKKILKLNQQAGSELSELEIKTIENTIKKIDQEIEKSKGEERGRDIYGLFGLNLDDDQKEAIDTSVSFAIDQLNNFLSERIKAANVAVQSADKEVASAQKMLDAEIEARANGYANNVAMAQKDLDLAKKNQAAALKEQQKAQKAQAALQTIQQIGNLVTSTSLIWSQLGFPWAIPAIAIMWGSFAAAKIKANQVAKSAETYGEGTVELLAGGSHQSGNDIDFGTKPDGTRRRAEGGEFFAVINKRNSRKYRSVIPDVINSLNNGTFANKYMTAYDGAGDAFVMNVNAGGTDIRELNDNVRAIREQSQRRTYVNAKGNIIEEYKNLKRVIK